MGPVPADTEPLPSLPPPMVLYKGVLTKQKLCYSTEPIEQQLDIAAPVQPKHTTRTGRFEEGRYTVIHGIRCYASGKYTGVHGSTR